MGDEVRTPENDGGVHDAIQESLQVIGCSRQRDCILQRVRVLHSADGSCPSACLYWNIVFCSPFENLPNEKQNHALCCLQHTSQT